MNSEEALKNLYKTYKKSNFFNKSELLFIIIQIKVDNIEYKNYKQSLYLDVKKFIIYYIKSIERKDYGYDKLELNKIIKAIECIKNESEKLELSIYTQRLININGYEDIDKTINEYKNQCKTKVLKKNKSFKNLLYLLSHILSYNLKTIILVLFIMFVITYIIFLPSKYECLTLFEIHYNNYSSNFYFNHFLNLLIQIFDLNSENIIIPLNWKGVVTLVFLKLVYVLILLNYLYQKALNILYAN